MVIGIGCHHLKGDAVSFNLAFLRRGKRIQYGDFFEPWQEALSPRPRARSCVMVTMDALLAGGWLHRLHRRARYLSLSQLGGVPFPQELRQLGDI